MIEYIESEHLYVWDGVIVPSVTQVVGHAVGANYSGVPAAVLAAKAAYGTAMHEWCEAWLKGTEMPLTDNDAAESAEQFKAICTDHGVKLLRSECIVGWRHRVCGRFDILADVGGKTTLIDIKTNAKFPEEYLRLQLSTYALAVNETLGITVDALAAIWLPKKRKAKWVDIDAYKMPVVLSMVNDYAISNAETETVLPY